VTVAVPVAPPESVRVLAREADVVVCLETPPALSAIGQWYDDFSQVPDRVVVALLAAARERQPPSSFEKS
jgi:predicted phosphoribosyltransferase